MHLNKMVVLLNRIENLYLFNILFYIQYIIYFDLQHNNLMQLFLSIPKNQLLYFHMINIHNQNYIQNNNLANLCPNNYLFYHN